MQHFASSLALHRLFGPDNLDKLDSHANEGFSTEGGELRRFLAENNMIVICGDRHWQYVSVDEKTGLREYGDWGCQ